jgi:hypothetical protein
MIGFENKILTTVCVALGVNTINKTRIFNEKKMCWFLVVTKLCNRADRMESQISEFGHLNSTFDQWYCMLQASPAHTKELFSMVMDLFSNNDLRCLGGPYNQQDQNLTEKKMCWFLLVKDLHTRADIMESQIDEIGRLNNTFDQRDCILQ